MLATKSTKRGGKRMAKRKFYPKIGLYKNLLGDIAKRQIEVTVQIYMYTDAAGTGYYSFNSNSTLGLTSEILSAITSTDEFQNMSSQYCFLQVTGCKVRYNQLANVSAIPNLAALPEMFLDLAPINAGTPQPTDAGKSQTAIRITPSTATNYSKYYALPNIVVNSGYSICGPSTWISSNAYGQGFYLALALGFNSYATATASTVYRMGEVEIRWYTRWGKPMRNNRT